MNFSPLARCYETLERLAFGPRGLDRARDAFLAAKPVAAARRVLLVGEGDGRFARALAGRLAGDARVDCLDASPAMLARTRLRLRGLPQAGRFRYQRGDARTRRLAPEAYDLLATHFFFDNFPAADVEAMLHRLDAAAAPGACWLHTDFATDGRLRTRVWHRLLYAFFGRVARVPARQLTDVTPTLRRLGWKPTSRLTFYGGLVTASYWTKSLYFHQHVTGVNGKFVLKKGIHLSPYERRTQ